MNKETLITSSGIIKNRSVARIGIVNASSLHNEFFEQCLMEGTDLSYETLYKETYEEIKEENSNLDDSEIEELARESMEMVEIESHFLLGAWVKDEDGLYIIDKSGKNGNFALEYSTGSGMVSVEWSKFTKECNNTSPCYVMADGSGPCGDLDTEGDAVVAYTLPPEMFRAKDDN